MRQRRKSNKGKIATATIVIAVILIAALAWYQANSSSPPPANAGRVLLVTSKGNITLQLYDDMPITTNNFINLVKQGRYNGTLIHRVAHDFVIQGGRIAGASVAAIPDENIGRHSNVEGSVAMAKAGANTATSEFYINLKDNTGLDSNYSVFGKVIGGMTVVHSIGMVQTRGDLDPTLTGLDAQVPVEDVFLLVAYLID